jgi:hypothetical protein
LIIQAFESGGYEATVRRVDLEKVGGAFAMPFEGGRRKREPSEEPSLENLQRSAMRAKSKVRKLVRNMGADHLCTLTLRETWDEVLDGEFWSIEDWGRAWDRLRRLLVKVIGDFPYVAVFEPHVKGNFHLHLAWRGKIPVNLMRPLWWAICGGRGQGNVDAKWFKVPYGGDRTYKIARYLSKYVVKQFQVDPRYNKKRYWASRQTLPELRRYVLKTQTVRDSLSYVALMLGLDWERIGRHLFEFPSGDGFWFSFIPELHGLPPPF